MVVGQSELSLAPFFNWFSFKCSDVWSSPSFFQHANDSKLVAPKNDIFKSDCSGFFAYGAKNCVIWCQIHGNLIRYVSTIKAFESVHEKVSTISFCRSQKSPVLFIGSNQGTALLYHFTKNKIQYEECQHISDDKIENSKIISSSDWLDDQHVFYSIDTFVVHWNIISKSIGHLRVSTKAGRSMKIDGIVISKVPPFLIAIAFTGGEISVVTISDQMMREKKTKITLMHGHQDICSLAFPYDNGSHASGLLASIARDGTLKVWELFTSELLVETDLETKKSPHSKAKNFFSLSFIPPHHIAGTFLSRSKDPRDSKGPAEIPLKLLISGSNGGLFLLDIPRSQRTRLFRPKLFEIEKEGKINHSNVIFNISSTNPYIYNSSGFGRDKKKEAVLQLDVPLIAVTTSLDRQAILWDLKSLKAKSSFLTLSHQVHEIAFNPKDVHSLAIASGDGLKIWKMQQKYDELPNPYRIITIRKNFPSTAKFHSLSWHPTLQDVLALGTDEGELFVINTSQSSLLYSCAAKLDFKSRIYSINWGPVASKSSKSKSTEWACYAVYAQGSVKVHIGGEGRVLDLNDISNCRRYPKKTDCVWKDDFNYLAVGFDNGSIEILINSGSLEVAVIIENIHTDLVQCIRWHPDVKTFYNPSKTSIIRKEQSKCEFWIATASSDNTIQLVDLARALAEYRLSGEVITVNKPMKTLLGHKDRVIRLSWCPSVDELLASCSYDQTVQVWHVKHGKPLYNFRGHWSRIFTLSWSPVDDELIFSGGDDSTVQMWNPLKQVNSTPPDDPNSTWELEDYSPELPKPAETVKKEEKLEEEDTEDFEKHLALLTDLEHEKKTYIPDIESSSSGEHHNPWDPNAPMVVVKAELVSAPMASIDESKEAILMSSSIEQPELASDALEVLNSSDDVQTSTKPEKPFYRSFGRGSNNLGLRLKSSQKFQPSSSSADKNKDRKKSLLPLTNIAENCSTKVQHLQDIEYLMQTRGLIDKSNNPIDSDMEFRILMFGGYPEITKLGAKESQHHAETGNHALSAQLRLVQGDFESVIREACKNNQVTEWMVAMSATVSRNFWTEVVECYAKQLESLGEYVQSALYFLSINHINNAIDVLIKHKLFKEALVLIKSRLPFYSNRIVDIMSGWAKEKETHGNFEAAAKILISIGRYEEAAELLSKRKEDPKCQLFAEILKGRNSPTSGQEDYCNDDSDDRDKFEEEEKEEETDQN